MKRKRGVARRPAGMRARMRRRRIRRRPATGRSAWARRAVLAAALLAVAFFPLPGPAAAPQPAACHGCRVQAASAERWAARLPGDWTAGDGATGTMPLSGQAYAAVGGGVAAVAAGLTVTAYDLGSGRPLWQTTLAAPAGAAIMSVRAWPGVVTAGVVAKDGRTRTEAVIGSMTGTVLRRYPAAVFGGAVAASAATTVVVGQTSVTSYDNGNGRIRWRRATGAAQTWRADGDILYVAESAGGYLGSAPVTALREIDLGTGTERTLRPPPGHAFSGTMALAADGAVLFTSASGVTAYSGSTGQALWSMTAAVPEGADPSARLVDLTLAGGTLAGVDPLTGAVRDSVPGSTAGGSAGLYVVRGGVALGIDSGQGGEAWGYSMTAGRVTWTAGGLPWPHFFADLSGLGGSAATSGDVVVIAVCPHLTLSSPAPAAPPVSSAPASPSTSSSPLAGPTVSTAPVQLCADPELVALNL